MYTVVVTWFLVFGFILSYGIHAPSFIFPMEIIVLLISPLILLITLLMTIVVVAIQWSRHGLIRGLIKGILFGAFLSLVWVHYGMMLILLSFPGLPGTQMGIAGIILGIAITAIVGIIVKVSIKIPWKHKLTIFVSLTACIVLLLMYIGILLVFLSGFDIVGLAYYLIVCIGTLVFSALKDKKDKVQQEPKSQRIMSKLRTLTFANFIVWMLPVMGTSLAMLFIIVIILTIIGSSLDTESKWILLFPLLILDQIYLGGWSTAVPQLIMVHTAQALGDPRPIMELFNYYPFGIINDIANAITFEMRAFLILSLMMFVTSGLATIAFNIALKSHRRGVESMTTKS